MQALQMTQPTLSSAPITSMNQQQIIDNVLLEVKAQFGHRDTCEKITMSEDDGNYTIMVNRGAWNIGSLWQEEANAIERAARIASPSLDIMIVIA